MQYKADIPEEYLNAIPEERKAAMENCVILLMRTCQQDIKSVYLMVCWAG